MVSAVILKNPATRSLSPIVVWIPMLRADELAAAREASSLFRDLGAPQFWDGSKKLGKQIAISIEIPNWTAWDVYLFYPPGVEWTERGLPAPAAALAQAGGVVVGTKGTLAPGADQARLPKWMIGHADVVGEQADLETLLRRVAEPFANRYAAKSTP